jgi:hypothetical protein
MKQLGSHGRDEHWNWKLHNTAVSVDAEYQVTENSENEKDNK